MNQRELDITRKILATKGKFFSVEFIKKDGSNRKMNCRLGVKRYLKGGENTVKSYDNLVTVWDTVAKDYRNINVETVTKFNGVNV